MACCYIAAFCIGQLVKACQFLDVAEGIRYNEDNSFVLSVIDGQYQAKERKPAPNDLILSLGGLTCSACTAAVESAVSMLPGVDAVRVSLALQQATVISSGGVSNANAILDTVRDLGYEAELGPRTPREIVELLQEKENIFNLKSSFSSLGQGVIILQLMSFVSSAAETSSFVSGSLEWLFHMGSMFTTIFIQWHYVFWIHRDGWKWVHVGSVNMNTLVSLSMILGSLLSFTDLIFRGPQGSSSYCTTTIGLALMVVSGRYLDALSRRSGVEHLIRLYKPLMEVQHVTLYPSKQLVPSSYLRPGDRIIIEPYTEVPCDCYISEGTSVLNESIVTGESLPVKKTIGDYLLGGTLNQHNRLICIVQKEKGDSFYTRLVQNSSESTSAGTTEGYDFIQPIMKYFATIVISVAFITSVLTACRSWHHRFHYEIFRHCVSRAMAVLTSACPCALGLAIPSAVGALVSSASKRGIVITGGIQTLRRLQSSRLVVFDKTGTLTEATLAVENVEVAPPWNDCTELFWKYVCALEEHVASNHPIARAIFTSGLRELGHIWLEDQSQRKCDSITTEGEPGISGQVLLDGKVWRQVKIGSLRYFSESEILGIPASILHPVNGMMSVHVSIDAKYAGTIFIGDVIRSGARRIIEGLKSEGYNCGLLTGDTVEAASRVSDTLNIPILGSAASPADKRSCIELLQKQGNILTMVGDGLNDGPSFAVADISIALHHDSAHAAMAASVMILDSRLESISLMYKMAQMGMDQIHFNLFWVFAYNITALTITSGLIKPFGVEINPPIAALIMSASSIFITFQSLQLQHRLDKLRDIGGKAAEVGSKAL